jgi:effector-binding domain-containing protein
MKKIAILLFLLLIILSLFFIPVTQQKEVSVKAPFLTLYGLLISPGQWEKWRPDLRNIADGDSSCISFHKNANSLELDRDGQTLRVRHEGNSLFINDSIGGKVTMYDYTLIPRKIDDSTSVIVTKKTSVIGYLLAKAGRDNFSDTHISDLKKFMETDSLRYGCHIFKTKVPEADLIEMKKEVLTKDQFITAANLLNSLELFIKANRATKMQPLIAQFLPKGRDSVQVNVGFFINKPVKPENGIAFVTMPKGGPLYTAKFSGRFDRRQKVYQGLHLYFTDHRYQSIILPFETYLDNKLPKSDTDRVNIRVNISAYF